MNTSKGQSCENSYQESLYAFFKMLRPWTLIAQCAQSILVVGLAWNMADHEVLLIYLLIAQLLVVAQVGVYFSTWTNSRIRPNGLPVFVRELTTLTQFFIGSVLWMLPETSETLVYAVSCLYFASGTGALVLTGPLKDFPRIVLISFLMPHGLACLCFGHYAVAAVVFAFLVIIGVGGVTAMGHSFAELVRLRDRSKQYSLKLEEELERRAQAEKEHRALEKELLVASRLAGKAEIATGVLHNIGNVMNSVNVSAGVVRDRCRDDIEKKLNSLIDLLVKEEGDLGRFFTNEPKAKLVIPYLKSLASRQSSMIGEVDDLIASIHRVNRVVSAQNAHAAAVDFRQTANVNDIIADTLRITCDQFQSHKIRYATELSELPDAKLDPQRLTQILVNLLNNACNAIDDANPDQRMVTIRTMLVGDRESIVIEITDTGVGIPQENLARIFRHGYTGRKDKGGHGYGLHHCINSAREVKWDLTAHSEGLNKGATFRLEIPLASYRPTPEAKPKAVELAV